MKEKTKKPRYNLGQNMLWMLRQAHAVHRDDVPVITVIRALAVAGTGISGLLLAPEIVRCVEENLYRCGRGSFSINGEKCTKCK